MSPRLSAIPEIQGGGLPQSRPHEDANVGSLSRVLPKELDRAVGRAAVDDQVLAGIAPLARDVVDAAGHEFCPIQDRRHYTQARSALACIMRQRPQSAGSGARPTMDGKRLSVVIPTRNRARLLGEALASLTRQTLPTGTLRGDRRRRRLDGRHAAGVPRVRARSRSGLPADSASGTAAAKNEGIRAAKGDVLFFFDDDDIAGAELLRRPPRCPPASSGA